METNSKNFPNYQSFKSEAQAKEFALATLWQGFTVQVYKKGSPLQEIFEVKWITNEVTNA